MHDLALFAIASDRNRWLAARAATVSSNIANADTPGYRSQEVVPFEAALELASVRPVQTHAGHLVPDGPGDRRFEVRPREDQAHKHSGNTVDLESELTQLGEIRSQHSVVTGVVSAFHRMLLQSSKG